jgi:hypothetical protein
MSTYEENIALLVRIAWLGAIVAIGFCVAPGFAATISRNSDIETSLAAMWSMMGPGTAGNWLAPFNLRATVQLFVPL